MCVGGSLRKGGRRINRQNRVGAGRGYKTPPKVSLNEFECQRKTIYSLAMMMKSVIKKRNTGEEVLAMGRRGGTYRGDIYSNSPSAQLIQL